MASFLGLNQHIAVDLGTAVTKVYLRGKGIRIDEPTIAAIDRATGEIVASGESARRMLGKNPDFLEIVKPLANGVVSEFDITERLLRYYIRRVCGNMRIFKPVVLVSVPARMTEIEARAVVDAATSAGARVVYLLNEPVASAIGCGFDISKPHGIMVIDIGGGTTDIAVITLNSLCATQSLPIAGNYFDEAIIRHVNRRFKLVIGQQSAEKLKCEVGCAYYDGERRVMDLKGRNFVTGLPQMVEAGSELVCDAVSDGINSIADAVRNVLERTPPELLSDIKTDGIILSGGGSLLRGLDDYLSMCLNVPVIRAQDPSGSVITGAAKALENLERFNPGVKGYFENTI